MTEFLDDGDCVFEVCFSVEIVRPELIEVEDSCCVGVFVAFSFEFFPEEDGGGAF